MDWLTADAYRLFARKVVLSEGAGAVYLRAESPAHPAVQLHSVTQSHLFLLEQDRARAARQMRTELHAGRPEHLLCDATQGLQNVDGAELEALYASATVYASASIYESFGLYDQLYALALATGFLGIAIHLAFTSIERRALRWHPSQRLGAT